MENGSLQKKREHFSFYFFMIIGKWMTQVSVPGQVTIASRPPGGKTGTIAT